MSPRSPESIFARHNGICEQKCSECNCPWRVWLILRENQTNADHVLKQDGPIDPSIIDKIRAIPISARSVLQCTEDGCEHVENAFAPPPRGSCLT